MSEMTPVAGVSTHRIRVAWRSRRQFSLTALRVQPDNARPFVTLAWRKGLQTQRQSYVLSAGYSAVW